MNPSSIKTINESILALAERIKDNWTLCNFAENMGSRACEKEVMIAQTIHACRINLKAHGKAFSFDECDRGCHNGGLVDNGTAISYLFRKGYFKAGKFQGKPTIIPTPKLLAALEDFFENGECAKR